MTAFYNELDAYCGQWLRNLAAQGHIADGKVETTSIEALGAVDLSEFTQCHFFAGIGVWSHALRLAGWPDSRPVWTGSCPCQPWSAAGKGEGFEDERDLWPAWFKLIQKFSPTEILGEQVASADGLLWLDVVFADLERAGYAVGVADLPAACVGAPHRRQRLFFYARLADAEGTGLDWSGDVGGTDESGRWRSEGRGSVGGLADNNSAGLGEQRAARLHEGGAPRDDVAGRGEAGDVVDADGGGRGAGSGEQLRRAESGREARGLDDADQSGPQGFGRPVDDNNKSRRLTADEAGLIGAAGATRGFWDGADWIFCRDGRWRPVEPGTFPLANGAAERVGRLRAFGNAITGPVAAVFIRAVMGP